jgi:CheY-like chemotaxis protein
MRPKPTVLLACSPAALPVIERALAGDARCVKAQSVEDAIERMEEGVDAIVCNMQFDESRMLELAREARTRCPEIPFICCKVLTTELSGAGVHAAETAARNLGVTTFVEASDAPGLRELAERLQSAVAKGH